MLNDPLGEQNSSSVSLYLIGALAKDVVVRQHRHQHGKYYAFALSTKLASSVLTTIFSPVTRYGGTVIFTPFDKMARL